jgi:hypothetical protein
MKIQEIPNQSKNLGIEINKSKTDQIFTTYNKKKDIYEPCDYIPHFMPRTNGVICYCGSPGSGKTTAALSLLQSKKYKLLYGVFDTILVSIPPSTHMSITDSPFLKLPEEQVWGTFDLDFLDYCIEVIEKNSADE